MHPSKINHLAVDYDLSHLRQKTTSFAWTNGNDQLKLAVRVRFSNHCYSLEHYGAEEPAGSHLIIDGERSRLFCPIRHKHSLLLPTLFKEMCEKPTISVALTAENNWSIYRMQMPSPMFAGEKYWVFFRVRPLTVQPDGTKSVDVYVESAYPRANRVVVFRRLPFGKLIAETTLEMK